MTSRTAWPTVASGDGWSASQHNTYGRDNDLAYWVYTTAGDTAYATSSSALARLAIGAANSIYTSTGSAPQWTARSGVPGMLHTKGTVDWTGPQTFSGALADITGATLTLTTTVTCTILVLATIVGSNQNTSAGNAFFVECVVNGVNDTADSNSFNGSAPVRNEGLPYIYLKTGVTAGSRIVKLQCKADGSDNIVQQGRIIALAIVE